jgi:hypothetical protein
VSCGVVCENVTHANYWSFVMSCGIVCVNVTWSLLKLCYELCKCYMLTIEGLWVVELFVKMLHMLTIEALLWVVELFV